MWSLIIGGVLENHLGYILDYLKRLGDNLFIRHWDFYKKIDEKCNLGNYSCNNVKYKTEKLRAGRPISRQCQ